MEGITYEAVVDCDDEDMSFMERMSGVYDPVETIIVRTAYHSYEIDPAKLRSLTIRKLDQ